MPYLLPATHSLATTSTNLTIIQRLFRDFNPLYSPLSERKLTLNFDPNESTHGIAHLGSGVAENIDCPFPAATIIQTQLAQLLSERGLQLNPDELFGFDGTHRRALVHFFRELLAKQLCLDLKAAHEHLPGLNNRLIAAKAEKAINTMHEYFLRRIIDQQTLAPVFDDIDVPGDGNCFYYAALAALIAHALSGAITPASPTTEALCAPDGFFAKIQARLRANDAYRGFTFQQPQSVAACFKQLLHTFQDHPYPLFEAIMVPALRASISDYAEASTGAIREQIAAHIQRLKQDPENLALANAAAYHINESALSAEEFAAHYAQVRDVGNQHPLGGPTEGAVLEFMLGVNSVSFDAKSTQAPLGATEPSLYIRNTGVHFHVGLLKTEDPRITRINQRVETLLAQTIIDWQRQQPQKAATAFELQPFYDEVQASSQVCRGGTADDYLLAIGQVKAQLSDSVWPLLDMMTQQCIADAIAPLISYIQKRSSAPEVVDQLAQLRLFTVIANTPNPERKDAPQNAKKFIVSHSHESGLQQNDTKAAPRKRVKEGNPRFSATMFCQRIATMMALYPQDAEVRHLEPVLFATELAVHWPGLSTPKQRLIAAQLNAFMAITASLVLSSEATAALAGLQPYLVAPTATKKPPIVKSSLHQNEVITPATLAIPSEKPPVPARRLGITSVATSHNEQETVIKKPLSRLAQSRQTKDDVTTSQENRVSAKPKSVRTPEEIAERIERLQAAAKRLADSQAKYAHLLPPVASSTEFTPSHGFITHNAAIDSAVIEKNHVSEKMPPQPATLKKKMQR